MKKDKSKEFERLQSWAETILSFLSASKTWGGSDYLKMDIDIFNQCVEKGSLGIMRMYVNDLKEIAKDNTEFSGELNALNRVLMEKFGEDLASSMAKKMDGVLKRGKIRNDDEFVRVNEWIDHLLYDNANPEAPQQIEQFNQLLRAYEEKAARKPLR